MHEGLPQGSVLAAILFLFHINHLASNIPGDVLVSLFANDLAALVQEEEKAKAEAKAQEVLDIVAAWSQESHSVLAPTKSQSSWLTTENNDVSQMSPCMALNC